MGMDGVEIVMRTEEVFGIEIPDEVSEQLLSSTTSESADRMLVRQAEGRRAGSSRRLRAHRPRYPWAVSDIVVDIVRAIL